MKRSYVYEEGFESFISGADPKSHFHYSCSLSNQYMLWDFMDGWNDAKDLYEANIKGETYEQTNR